MNLAINALSNNQLLKLINTESDFQDLEKDYISILNNPESIRHAITKFSHLHFVASKRGQKYIIKLGENKKNVFNFGSLAFSNLKHEKFKNKYITQYELEAISILLYLLFYLFTTQIKPK